MDLVADNNRKTTMLRPAVVRTLLQSYSFLILAVAAAAQPRIDPGGIVNAASYAGAGMPNAGIAPGSLFVVRGEGLGVGFRESPGFPLSRELNGSSVSVLVQGVTVQAFIVSVSPQQIRAILPSFTPSGKGTVTVVDDHRESQPESISVLAERFGIFTRNSAGSGPALLQNLNAGGQPMNTLTEPARPGQRVVLWGTGLGAVHGDEAAGPIPGDLNAGAEVLV